MTWNYRVVKMKGAGLLSEDFYDIREVYYNEDGSVKAWSQEGADPSGDDLLELAQCMARIMRAITEPVLVEARDTVTNKLTLVEVPDGDTNDTGAEREQCLPERDAPVEERRDTGGES